MAGSRESGDGAPELVAVESFLRRVFFSCLAPSEVIEKLNITAAGTPDDWTWRDWKGMLACAMQR
jgi:hypothetical protein